MDGLAGGAHARYYGRACSKHAGCIVDEEAEEGGLMGEVVIERWCESRVAAATSGESETDGGLKSWVLRWAA